jgi:hypothetical protein
MAVEQTKDGTETITTIVRPENFKKGDNTLDLDVEGRMI